VGIAAAALEPDRQAAVVDAATRGDARAFAALYDVHVERVFRHVYYRVGNRADAEDLTQQVFLQAWRAIGRYRRTGAPFLAWLFVIAQNAVAGFYRRRKEAASLDFEPAVRDLWADPEDAALAGHDRAVVRRAILRLKPEWQQVVIMRFVEGLDHATVAAALGVSEGKVRVVQHRALRELRRQLAHRVTP
jgi:RNA polymerase sigma-70 factor (ECF subfamily)